MPLPKVAIIGRPNVGKSSLFNALAGVRIAIVEPTPGVTRDRLAFPLCVDGENYVELIDTGGIGIVDSQALSEDVEKQIQVAIQEADLILFMVDVRDGIVPLDQHVSERLRTLGKPVVLIVNKCDTDALEIEAQNFQKLGWSPMICVSAHQGRGRSALLEQIIGSLGERLREAPPPAAVAMKIAIVGRRNVGKSTFINCLAQEERVIVSEVAGTTRDSVDVRFERDGLTFIAIDTAGVRKKAKIDDSIEFYSLARAERSIRRADVVLQFFDPNDTINQVDKHLAAYILEEHKPAIFVVNKWDTVKDRLVTSQWADYLRQTFPAQDYVPISFVSGKDGKNVYRLLNLAQNLFKQATTRLTTADLNRLLRDAIAHRPPPVRQNRTPRLYYATQVATQPPTIVAFTNGPELFDEWYCRYLLRQLRDHSAFSEIPIKLLLRLRGEDAADEEEQRSPPGKKRRPPRTRRSATEPSVPAEETAREEKKPSRGRRPRRPPAPDIWRDL